MELFEDSLWGVLPLKKVFKFNNVYFSTFNYVALIQKYFDLVCSINREPVEKNGILTDKLS